MVIAIIVFQCSYHRILVGVGGRFVEEIFVNWAGEFIKRTFRHELRDKATPNIILIPLVLTLHLIIFRY